MLTRIFVCCALLLFALSGTHAAEVGVVETFGDDVAPIQNGWSVGNLGSVTADSGENGVGDHAIEYATDRGLHFLAPAAGAGTVNPAFLGDYLAAGATAIRFNARHSGIGVDVDLRATAFGDFNNGVDWVTSSNPLVLTANDTTWQTYELSLDPADLFAGGDNGLSINDVLGDVFQIGLRHDPLGTGPGDPAFVATVTQVYFDDVVLVPEPTSISMVLMLLLGLARLRR